MPLAETSNNDALSFVHVPDTKSGKERDFVAVELDFLTSGIVTRPALEQMAREDMAVRGWDSKTATELHVIVVTCSS